MNKENEVKKLEKSVTPNELNTDKNSYVNENQICIYRSPRVKFGHFVHVIICVIPDSATTVNKMASRYFTGGQICEKIT